MDKTFRVGNKSSEEVAKKLGISSCNHGLLFFSSGVFVGFRQEEDRTLITIHSAVLQREAEKYYPEKEED